MSTWPATGRTTRHGGVSIFRSGAGSTNVGSGSRVRSMVTRCRKASPAVHPHHRLGSSPRPRHMSRGASRCSGQLQSREGVEQLRVREFAFRVRQHDPGTRREGVQHHEHSTDRDPVPQLRVERAVPHVGEVFRPRPRTSRCIVLSRSASGDLVFCVPQWRAEPKTRCARRGRRSWRRSARSCPPPLPRAATPLVERGRAEEAAEGAAAVLRNSDRTLGRTGCSS